MNELKNKVWRKFFEKLWVDHLNIFIFVFDEKLIMISEKSFFIFDFQVL